MWEGEDGSRVVSCCVVTTAPNELVAEVHDRMPVILGRDAYAEWLDPGTPESRLKEQLALAPYPADRMAARVVGPKVNSPRNDGPECVEAA